MSPGHGPTVSSSSSRWARHHTLRNVYVGAHITFSVFWPPGPFEFLVGSYLCAPRERRARCRCQQHVNLSIPARLPAPASAHIFKARLDRSTSFQVIGNTILMGKKKSSNTQVSRAASKAAKKAKAAQKTERKEKKKSGKAKDEFDDDQDLEAILENVSKHSAFASRCF